MFKTQRIVFFFTLKYFVIYVHVLLCSKHITQEATMPMELEMRARKE